MLNHGNESAVSVSDADGRGGLGGGAGEVDASRNYEKSQFVLQQSVLIQFTSWCTVARSQ